MMTARKRADQGSRSRVRVAAGRTLGLAPAGGPVLHIIRDAGMATHALCTLEPGVRGPYGQLLAAGGRQRAETW